MQYLTDTSEVPGIADNANLAVKRNRLTMLGTEVRKIFEPVVMEVIKLVLEQMTKCNKPVKNVLLVGGFGSNPYLRDEIAKEVKRISATTTVIQPQNGCVRSSWSLSSVLISYRWTAVVRGALMKALAETSPTNARVRVSTRFARKHFGLDISFSFEEGTHDRAKRYVNFHERQKDTLPIN